MGKTKLHWPTVQFRGLMLKVPYAWVSLVEMSVIAGVFILAQSFTLDSSPTVSPSLAKLGFYAGLVGAVMSFSSLMVLTAYYKPKLEIESRFNLEITGTALGGLCWMLVVLPGLTTLPESTLFCLMAGGLGFAGLRRAWHLKKFQNRIEREIADASISGD